MARWRTGPIERSGMKIYEHLVRAKGDPERVVSALRAARAKQSPPTLRRAINKLHTADLAQQILEHVRDGAPRTFQRIAVEMTHESADALWGTKFDDALWLLVEREVVAHTTRPPIRFRTTESLARR